jgi:NNP family nitrate/nitrite transporter-like MFS transporter
MGEIGYIHAGYVVVAVTMLPIVALNAYVYRPEIASRANVDGFLFDDSGTGVQSADD